MPYNRRNVYYVEGEWGGRICVRCGWFRSWWEFNKGKKGFKEYGNICKRCKREDYLGSREYKLKKQKQYDLLRKDEIKKYQKQYTLEHKEEKIEYDKQYRYSPVSYDKYVDKLTIEESPRKTKEGYLEVKCSLCGKYFIPTNQQVQHRIRTLNGNQPGESRLYCSEKCKEACPVYYQKETPKGFKNPNTIKRSFPVDFRNMVLERDNYQCVICGSTDNLTVHHSDPFATCKMFENDMDGAFTLCEEHDKKAHSISGCTLPELRKASQEMIKELQEKGIDLNEVPEWALDKYLKK